MALPRQVSLQISYDGTAKRITTEESNSNVSGDMSYTVVKGDSLWNIAKRFLGSGTQYITIYNANVNVIESTARAHGKPNANNGETKGWWIWPGEVLIIPGAGTQDAITVTKSVKAVGISNPKLGEKIAKQVTAFSYTDVASGQSDSISITMQDIGKEWMGNLMPQKGADFGVKIGLTNWNKEGSSVFDCGTFVLDDISFSGRPTNCVLGGVSVPAMDDFKSLPCTNTWEKTTVQEIASQIATKAGVALYYDADTIQIAEIEQNNQTDSAFLYSICEKYGLAMKVYNQKLVIFDIVKYEEKGTVEELKESDMAQWSYNTTVEGTYTGINLNYTDPDTEDSINVTLGSQGRMYAINTQASSRYDAELQAAAKINAANRSIETMEITIKANTDIVASHCIRISGLGNIDGKYYIDKIKHSIGSGYKMQLSMHKVQTPIKVTAPPHSVSSGSQTYTVVKGDTLWGISKKFYGTGTKWNIIYDANADLIEVTAKAHGKKNSENGHWIWAGEKLTIPEG